jgi:hypothetical protein
MPPLSISEDELRSLVEITQESIRVACRDQAAARAATSSVTTRSGAAIAA